LTFRDNIVILNITLFNNGFNYDIDENTFQMRFAAMIITALWYYRNKKPVPIFLYRGDTAADVLEA
jgi:hypothetical protein